MTKKMLVYSHYNNYNNYSMVMHPVCTRRLPRQRHTSLHKKRFLKKKPSWCRGGSINECTGWQSTLTDRNATQWYALHNRATLFNNHQWHAMSALIYCYLCRDGCWIMWPCYGVHITVWHSLFVYFVSQCIHWAIPASARFLLRNLFLKFMGS